jgi:hypothetical protein
MTKVCDRRPNTGEMGNEGIKPRSAWLQLDPSFFTNLDLSLISPSDKTNHVE